MPTYYMVSMLTAQFHKLPDGTPSRIFEKEAEAQEFIDNYVDSQGNDPCLEIVKVYVLPSDPAIGARVQVLTDKPPK